MKLTEKDSALLQEIRTLDDAALRGKDRSGVPYLRHIFNLHLLLFGETCDSCPGRIPEYTRRVKNFKTTETMKKVTDAPASQFKLTAGTIIPIRGTSKAISEHNLTDEIALDLLSENPNRKVLFEKIPKNVDELIEAHKATKGKSAAGDHSGSQDAPAVVIGIHKLEVAKAKELLVKAGITTKAETVEGLNKKIKALADDELKKLTDLADAGLADINVEGEKVEGGEQTEGAN